MMYNFRKIMVPVIVVLYYVIIGYAPFLLKGMLSYIIPALFWVSILSLVLGITGLSSFLSQVNDSVVYSSLISAFLYLTVAFYGGMIHGFGLSPYSRSLIGMLINTVFVLSIAIGREFSRGFILKTFKSKHIFLTFILTTLLYTITEKPFQYYLNLNLFDFAVLIKFLGSVFLPLFSRNVFLSILVILSGPLASLAYLLPIELFYWWSPILPSLPWGFNTFLGVVLPILSLVITFSVTSPSLLKRVGMYQLGVSIKGIRHDLSQLKSLTTFFSLAILTVWLSTGLLGIYPNVVYSGSMQPTFDVGDLIIAVKVPADRIAIDDILLFMTPHGLTAHRVVDIRISDKTRIFITKGDANNAPDIEPVHYVNVKGKVVLTFPKIGWFSIYMKSLLALMFSLFYSNFIALTGFIASISLASYLVYNYSNKKVRRWGGWR